MKILVLMTTAIVLWPFLVVGEVTSIARPKTNAFDHGTTCEETFRRYSCQEKINAAGPNRRKNYIDCSGKTSTLKNTRLCGAYLALGAGVSTLTLAAPGVVLPLVGGILAYRGLKAEESCFKNISYKKKILRPLTALHSPEYTDRLAMRLACFEIERMVVASIRVHAGRVSAKELNQSKFEVELRRIPSRRARLERMYPPSKRILSEKERRFKAVLEDIKKEESQLESTVDQINRGFRCASIERKTKIFCEILGGGIVGGIRLSGITKRQKGLSVAESIKPPSNGSQVYGPLIKEFSAGRNVLVDGEQLMKYHVKGGSCGPTCAVNLAQGIRVLSGKRPFSDASDAARQLYQQFPALKNGSVTYDGITDMLNVLFGKYLKGRDIKVDIAQLDIADAFRAQKNVRLVQGLTDKSLADKEGALKLASVVIIDPISGKYLGGHFTLISKVEGNKVFVLDPNSLGKELVFEMQPSTIAGQFGTRTTVQLVPTVDGGKWPGNLHLDSILELSLKN